MTESSVSFIVGRGGVVHLVRESGSRQKCGFRFREGHIEVFDRQAHEWYRMPDSLLSQRGGVVSIIVFDEEAQELP